MNDTREFLEKALDELRTRGWCQGTSTDSTGRVCMAEALRLVYVKTRKEGVIFPALATMDARRMIEAKCGEVVGHGPFNIIKYNDRVAKTPEDAIMIFEKAIADCP